MEDLALAVEKRAERLVREVDDLARALGLVEVELVAGEEPEEGVEFEVVTDTYALSARDLCSSHPVTGDGHCAWHGSACSEVNLARAGFLAEGDFDT
jgi:hypothetical protein